VRVDRPAGDGGLAHRLLPRGAAGRGARPGRQPEVDVESFDEPRAAPSPRPSRSAPSSSCPTTPASPSASRAGTSTTTTSTNSSSNCASASPRSTRSSEPPAPATTSRSTSRRGRRRGARVRRASRTPSTRSARRRDPEARRGAASARPRATSSPTSTRSPTSTPSTAAGGRVHRHRQGRAREARCRTSTTTSPRPRRSSTRSTSCARTCATRPAAPRIQQAQHDLRGTILEAYLAKVDVPLPPTMVEADAEQRMHQLEHQAERFGMGRACCPPTRRLRPRPRSTPTTRRTTPATTDQSDPA
jgi:hypothetical protein